MEDVGSLELIFVLAPCRAGKNVEKMRDGFKHPSLGATSRVILKYGSCKRAFFYKNEFIILINNILFLTASYQVTNLKAYRNN